MKPLILFLYLSALSFAAGLKKLKYGQIIGGTVVNSRRNFSYQASIRVHGKHTCGGSIISDSLILSAAHCFVDNYKMISESNVVVVIGDLNLFHPDAHTAIRRVETIFIHHRYLSLMIWNDISIVKLKEKLTWDEFVRPIQIANSPPIDGAECVASGWGISNRLNIEIPNPDLLETHVTVVGVELCLKAYLFVFVDKSKICFFSNSSCVHKGDSGGPLVCNGLLTGIISFGKKNTCENVPSVCTNVPYYLDWIDYVISINKSITCKLMPSIFISLIVLLLIAS